MNRFIIDFNKAYTIHIQPEQLMYPKLEDEFLKNSKQLFNEDITQQMQDSSHATSLFKKLKSYLLSTHGKQMSNF